MSKVARVLAIAVCAAYPVLNHVAAVRAEPYWSAFGLALIVGAAAAGWTRRVGATAACAAAALALALALAFQAPSVLLCAPSVAINGALCVAFAATLRANQEPLVARFARLTRGGQLPAELARYTRCLTGVWAAFFAVMASISLVLALVGSVGAWSLFTNVLNYLLVALFFVVEYVYRRLRYRQHSHVSPWQMVRRLGDEKIAPRPDTRA